MITEGKIALFCGKEINKAALGNRDHYGGGFLWTRTDTHIQINMFFRYADIGIPSDSRLHLFGTTPEQTIGCIVLESISTPDALLNAPPNALIRNQPIDIPYKSVLDYTLNVEFINDDVIDLDDFM